MKIERNGYLRVVTKEELVATNATTPGLEHAREYGVCRICKQPISLPFDPEYPERYEKFAGLTVGTGDEQVTLSYGGEFAHTRCLIRNG